MPRLRPRPLLTAAAMLALIFAGALLNVLIAWASARWADHRPTSGSGPVPITSVPPIADAYLNDPDFLRAFGHTPETIRRREFVTDPNAPGSPTRQTGLEQSESRSLACTRAEWRRWFDNEWSHARSHLRIQFGLPLRSMQYEEQSRYSMAAFPEYGFWRLPGPRGGWPIAPDPRAQNSWGGLARIASNVYPLTPIPLGFALNTLLYAALLYALLLAPRHIRRARRRRKGLCLKCGYPIGASSVCTECGVEVGR